jgi:hypothetical protein
MLSGLILVLVLAVQRTHRGEGGWVALTATWAPDSRRIVVTETDGVDTRLVIKDVLTGKSEPIIDAAELADPVSWAGDGRIAYSLKGGICVVDPALPDEVSCPAELRGGRYPTWSPDSRYLAFARQRNRSLEPAVFDFRNSVTHPVRGHDLSLFDQFNEQFAWAPDSRSFAYVTLTDDETKEALTITQLGAHPITRVVASASSTTRLTRWRGRDVMLVTRWSPANLRQLEVRTFEDALEANLCDDLPDGACSKLPEAQASGGTLAVNDLKTNRIRVFRQSGRSGWKLIAELWERGQPLWLPTGAVSPNGRYVVALWGGASAASLLLLDLNNKTTATLD